MNITIFNNLTGQDKTKAIEKLIQDSTPHQDFFMMAVLSVLMATFGLLIDSAAVIIGSMLIAPILYPVLSLSLGVVMSDSRLISRSFYTILKSIGLGVVSAMAIALLFNHPEIESNHEIIARTAPSLAYAAIAVIAGLAASFALIKPKLNGTLPGIAISVALIPPMAVIGIGIARWNWGMTASALVLLLINILGIIFASMIVFSLMNLYIKRKIAREIVEKEDEKLDKANGESNIK